MTTYAFVTGSPREIAVGLLIVPVFQGPEPGPGAKETRTFDAYVGAKLTGKKGENLLVPKRRGDRFAAEAVLLVGVGAKEDFDLTSMRRSLGRVGASARRFGSAATTCALAFGAKQSAEAVQTAAEGLALGAYRFDRYRSKKDPAGPLKKVVVAGSSRWDAKAARAALTRADVIVDAVCWARDLVNTPAADMSPATIAREAQKMARQVGLTAKVWTEAQLKQGGFGGIIGVGQGSANPPRMIELTYTGAGRAKPIGLTGKGIAFDSGGLSIKSAEGMETMKCDMGGAASILATMKVLARLKPKINVIAVIPSSENMPSGSAQRPGDVITHRGGTTSEVMNTDAEGRLILADSLAYLAEKGPSLMVDTATLTGACMVALGAEITGAMGNDDDLVQEIVAAGDAVGEPTWQLPLHHDYRQLIDSKVADVKNTGKRYGGAITAALFLAEFVGETPWCHLDIAGPAFTDAPHDLGPPGGTGAPVRTLVRFVLDRAGA
ncbi:MAG: leucyl aminopeptidase [Actinomycetota bacterium]